MNLFKSNFTVFILLIFPLFGQKTGYSIESNISSAYYNNIGFIQPFGFNLKLNMPYLESQDGLLRFNLSIIEGVFLDSMIFNDESIKTKKYIKPIGTIGFGFRISLMQLFFFEANNTIFGQVGIARFNYTVGTTSEIFNLPFDLYVGKDVHITSSIFENKKGHNWNGLNLSIRYYFGKRSTKKPLWRIKIRKED